MLSEIAITDRSVVADGQPFGAAGPYEALSGGATFAIDPLNPVNAPICDLALAPRDAAGRVTCSADIWLLRPLHAAGDAGMLLFDVINRGNKTALRLCNAPVTNRPRHADHFGDGLLLRRGVTIAACAWQWDVAEGLGRMRFTVPAAPVAGLVRAQFVPGAPAALMPLADRTHLPLAPADPAQADATLTERDAPLAEPRPIARARWRFCGEVDGAPAAGRSHIVFTDGEQFAPGRIYEVVYRGENAPLAGLGLAAVRDFAAFLRDRAAPGNPLAENGRTPPARLIAFGASQSGRLLRHFLQLGFNEDEAGRTVFDGVMADIAGAPRGSFNHRFAQPSRFDRGHEGHGFPTEAYPFNDSAVPDPLSERNAGALDTLLARGHAPKIFYTNTSAEYWGKGASLIHTDPLGTRDVTPPDNVRIYHFAGTQHVVGPFPPGAAGYQPGEPEPVARYPGTPVNFRLALRALFFAMDDWLRDGMPPPPSCHPTIADGTLVTGAQARAQWPAVPGAEFPPAPRASREYEYGPRWAQGIIDREPPGEGHVYPARVAALDADGHERAGVLLPEVAVPLATYTGWNYRHPDRGAPAALASILGSYFPLPATAAAAAASGDPRTPIAARYAGREDFLARVRAATEALIARRLLLAEDLAAVLDRAAAQWELEAAAPNAVGRGV